MEAAVCLVVQNECRDLTEWVLHHLAIGFSAVIIYDNDSDDGTAELIARLAKLLPVIHVHWPAAVGDNLQAVAYLHCMSICKGQFDWVACIDADEFLVCAVNEKVVDLLSRLHEHDHIVINWMMFGSSGVEDNAGQLVLETFTLRAPEDFGPNRHVKSIVRPDRVQNCSNAHTFLTDGGPVDVFGHPVDAWTMPGVVEPQCIIHGPWRLHHYFTRSRAHWARRRLRRGSGGINPARSEADFISYDRNEIQDLTALRHVPPIRRAMQNLRIDTDGRSAFALPAMAAPSRATIARRASAFRKRGFIALRGLFSEQRIDQVRASIDSIKQQRSIDVVVDNVDTGVRTSLGLLSADDVRNSKLMINDLHLRSEAVRDLALAGGLVPILRALLGQVPCLCSSVYLDLGSARTPPVDASHSAPLSHGQPINVWVALEDSPKDAGRLEYFPGSHLVEQVRTGGDHAVESEAPDRATPVVRAVAEAGLRKSAFKAKKGDVFIWHPNLLFGAGPVGDAAHARASCVFHYCQAEDVQCGLDPLVPQAGAVWVARAPLPLPANVARNLPFSEKSYLARYADVARAVKAGHIVSGREHYEAFGRAEGRLPR